MGFQLLSIQPWAKSSSLDMDIIGSEGLTHLTSDLCGTKLVCQCFPVNIFDPVFERA